MKADTHSGVIAPTESQGPATGVAAVTACSAPLRFFWEQNYEIGDGVHWALNDTESRKEGKVSCCYMVLFADYPTAMDGKPVGEQFMPALIVRLLNEHYAKQNAAHQPRRGEKLKP
jgi:hypothetical protein